MFLSFRSQPHILDLAQARLVFGLDLVDLLLCIVVDLLHGLFVVALQRYNLTLQLLNLIFQNLDVVLMGLLLLIDFKRVHLKHVCLRYPEFRSFFLGLVLKLLISCSILQHFLRVVIALGF